jgi:hypothetical protein
MTIKEYNELKQFYKELHLNGVLDDRSYYTFINELEEDYSLSTFPNKELGSVVDQLLGLAEDE